jgi:hypothetical protein
MARESPVTTSLVDVDLAINSLNSISLRFEASRSAGIPRTARRLFPHPLLKVTALMDALRVNNIEPVSIRF